MIFLCRLLIIRLLEYCWLSQLMITQPHVCIFKMAESLFGLLSVRKRNIKSSVWQNFGLMATEDSKVIEKEQENL